MRAHTARLRAAPPAAAAARGRLHARCAAPPPHRRRAAPPAAASAAADAGGGSSGGSGHSGGGGGGGGGRRDGDSPPPPRRGHTARLAAGVAAAALLAQSLAPRRADTPTTPDAWADTSRMPVTIIIPALNEAAGIGTTLRCVAALRPRPDDVIVSVGPSTDATAAISAAAGAHVVRGARGRVRARAVAFRVRAARSHFVYVLLTHFICARTHHTHCQAAQMNAGAEAAASRRARRAGAAAAHEGALLFLHADTRVPPDVVACVRGALASPRVAGGGFVSLIESTHKTWWFQTLHNGACVGWGCARTRSLASHFAHTPLARPHTHPLVRIAPA
jgi:hypothetical protein